MKKHLYIVALLVTVLYADGGFKKSLIMEYSIKAKSAMNQSVYTYELKRLKSNRIFVEATALESEQYSSEKKTKGDEKRKVDLSFYDRIIPLLCKAAKLDNSILPYYIAVEISEHLWLMRNETLNKSCLKEGVKALYDKRFCNGYLYHGTFLWQDGKRGEAVGILWEGAKNCKDPYISEKIKKRAILYKYKNTHKEKKYVK